MFFLGLLTAMEQLKTSPPDVEALRYKILPDINLSMFIY